MVKQRRRVALLVETSRAFGRGMVRGVAQYSRDHGPWAVSFSPYGLDEPPPEWLEGWKGDGILARIENQRMADAVRRTGAPCVELRGMLPDLGFPHIGVDNRAAIQSAIKHLVDRGLRQFGFFGFRRGDYARMDEREDCFVETMQAERFPYSVFQDWTLRPRAHDWETMQRRLARWLKSLAKPVGIVTANDDCGLRLLEACGRAEVNVPEQVAVVGIDNDEYLCILSLPPLTSVDILPQQIGYQAAAILDRMMDGIAPESLKIRTPPGPVVARQSTDVLAAEDRDVVSALAFMHEHACDRIKVVDVAQHVGLSPTSLEARVRKVIGRTVYQEIQRVQIEQVRELLTDSDLSIKQIARRCGFKYTQYLSRVFREATGRTLLEYRKQMRM